MQELLKLIDQDEEIRKMRIEWKEQKSNPFPVYNYDQYGGIDDYKQKVREILKK